MGMWTIWLCKLKYHWDAAPQRSPDPSPHPHCRRRHRSRPRKGRRIVAKGLTSYVSLAHCLRKSEKSWKAVPAPRKSIAESITTCFFSLLEIIDISLSSTGSERLHSVRINQFTVSSILTLFNKSFIQLLLCISRLCYSIRQIPLDIFQQQWNSVIIAIKWYRKKIIGVRKIVWNLNKLWHWSTLSFCCGAQIKQSYSNYSGNNKFISGDSHVLSKRACKKFSTGSNWVKRFSWNHSIRTSRSKGITWWQC